MNDTDAKEVDAVVNNFAPDTDVITIAIGAWSIVIARSEDGEVSIIVEDTDEGSETSYILGKEGYTQKI